MLDQYVRQLIPYIKTSSNSVNFLNLSQFEARKMNIITKT